MKYLEIKDYEELKQVINEMFGKRRLKDDTEKKGRLVISLSCFDITLQFGHCENKIYVSFFDTSKIKNGDTLVDLSRCCRFLDLTDAANVILKIKELDVFMNGLEG